jgi:hypothetical protein
MERISLLLSLLLCACATSPELPADVQRFVERRDICDHLRGEFSGDASDKERQRDLLDGVATYCTGTDKELATLRGRYVGNQRVIEQLSKYEFRIEPRPQ